MMAENTLEKSLLKPPLTTVLLGVLAYLKEMGIDGIPFTKIHRLFHKASEAGYDLADLDYKLTTSDIQPLHGSLRSRGKPFAEELDTSITNLYRGACAYYDICPGRSNGDKTLRIRDDACRYFLFCSGFCEDGSRGYSQETLAQIVAIAKFIANELAKGKPIQITAVDREPT